MITLEIKTYFVERLLAWYETHKRDLPWRRTKDPYRIWVSEIMLQQTRVETVIPYYERFLQRFPTLNALADAPEEEVLKLWEGLGYYSRARNLQAAVREVQENYSSKVPDTPEEISSLKGVGPYTAGAILSIAYGVPAPAVDGNVMRVMSRYFLIETDITKNSTRTHMESIIRDMIPDDAAGEFTQALMELGAMVCTPKSPSCLTCPVMLMCQGRQEGKEETLPVKKKAKAPRLEARAAVIIHGTGVQEGRILLRKRPSKGLLADMWELPHVELESEQQEETDADRLAVQIAFEQEEGICGIEVGPHFLKAEHVFSHIRWQMNVYTAQLQEGQQIQPTDRLHWILPEEYEEYPMPNVFIRILRAYCDELRASDNVEELTIRRHD